MGFEAMPQQAENIGIRESGFLLFLCLCIYKGIACQAFEKELNVNLTTVSRWETGKSKPNMSTMRQIKEFCTKYNADYEPLESSWLAFEREK